MGIVERVDYHQNHPSPPSLVEQEKEEEENKFVLSSLSSSPSPPPQPPPPPPPPPFLMNIMATSSKGYSSVSQANTYLDPQQQQHQHLLQFAPPLGLQDHHHHHHHHHHHDDNQISFGMMNHSPPSSSIHPPTNNNYLRKDGTGPYDLADLDQALFLYMDSSAVAAAAAAAADPSRASSTVQDQQGQNPAAAGMRPPTLNIFPSQPMHVVEPSSTPKGNGTGLVSPASSGSKRASEPSINNIANPPNDAPPAPAPQSSKSLKREGNKKGPTSSSEQDSPKTPDPKTLRRLAQNREAARKSRLRKKAYVQQLESSRIKLTQLEQELQRARAQGFFLGGAGVLGADQGFHLGMGNISSDAAVFDVEYARWLEDHHHRVNELRNALQDHIPENDLRIYVESCIQHIDDLMNLKSIIAKSDACHIVSGVWKTPAERCFMWIGGFRPSEIIKLVVNQVEPLTEQQIVAICQFQHTMQEAEEALSQGLESLNHSISETIASENLNNPSNMTTYMGQMAIAMNKLSTLENFIRQADNLRLETIHRLHQNLTMRQSARSILVITEYFQRLRSLSSLWIARPRQD